MNIHLKNICVATDFSAEGEQSLRYGAALAMQNSASMHLLHVIPSVESLMLYPSETHLATDYVEQMQATADLALRKLPNHADWVGLTIVYAIRSGVPYDQICRYVDEAKIDLLVLGTHGHSGFRHFLLGSVAERVVRNSPCPVLTVRLKQRPFVATEVPAEEVQVVVGPPETTGAAPHHAKHLHFADHSSSSTGFVAPGGHQSSNASLAYPQSKAAGHQGSENVEATDPPIVVQP